MEKKQIIQCEEKLREAMVASDVEILSELLHDELIFVNHFGQRLTKTADLQAHRSGLLNFTSIELVQLLL
ncbi:nuclear transport factor 2 family protein [Lysinibacillus sphaericus]|uniref:Cytochrome p-450:nadph-p-450 reductase n=1 Tax=Lysinibacillus sphaericus OT4b.31 TaxID=1285586 RepID=R7Z8D4_LYSSH|nr:nuclear transport factor 2 family protein [Lysinibacillus sphaericus]EON70284.1 cytochrome p-450:nadph-p-450 reductase [Lysinibacillus sphaericus OT4b.31]